MGLFSPKNAFVLSCGDHGTVLTLVRGGRAEDAWVGSNDPARFEETFSEPLKALSHLRVYLLLDVVEQIYREEDLPRLNPFDQGKIVRRHLRMTFGRDMLKAALPQGRGSRRIGRPYLMIGVPLEEKINGMIAALEAVKNPFGGVFLLPLESRQLARQLAASAAANEPPARWQVLVGYNATGGMRQIVLRNGRFVMTRMMPVPFSEETGRPELSAADIRRDFEATLGYLRRRGYTRADALDAVFLASSRLGEALRAQKWPARSVCVLTPDEAANRLGLGSVSPHREACADVLHALWFVLRRKRLRFIPPKEETRIRRRLVGLAGVAVASILTLGTALYLGKTALDLYRTEVTLSEATATRNMLLRQKRDKEKNKAPLNADRMRRLLAAHAIMRPKAEMTIPGVFAALGEVLPADVPVTALHYSRQGGSAMAWRVRFSIALPASIRTPEAAMAFIWGTRRDLARRFSGWTVEIRRAPFNVLPDQTLAGDVTTLSGRGRGDPLYQVDLVLKEGSAQ